MSWITFVAGAFVGAVFGAAVMACCALSSRADLDQEWMDRQGRVDR
jgi:hypothetical protein